MRYNAVIAGLIVVIILSFPAYSAADTTDINSCDNRLLTESGIIIGWGTGDISEGKHYEPILLILGCDLKRLFPQLEDHRGVLSLYVEPQINPVFNPETDIEFGVGVGLKYMHPVTEKISAYIFGSTGPHYITVKTREQTDGFIFSDTIGAGIAFFLTEKSSLNLEYRFRHISNASLVRPNGGIDTHFGMIGYS
ncbi:MAG: acyloxyacyl hydrolase, partial [Deltaproteobacteria bacterium]|nr:acyloxyacyl hydrolase [Deltaproteobacteria bacterium]